MPDALVFNLASQFNILTYKLSIIGIVLKKEFMLDAPTLPVSFSEWIPPHLPGGAPFVLE